MKRLLIATDSFLPRWDGISRFLLDLIPFLTKRFTVTVVAPAFEGKEVSFPGVMIVRIPLKNYKISDYTPARLDSKVMKALVRENDIIFSQTIGPVGGLAIVQAKKQKKPVIKYTHSVDWELVSESVSKFKGTLARSIRLAARYINNRCSLILYPSKDIAEKHKAIGIKAPDKIVELGIDIDKFCPPFSKEMAKKKLGIEEKKKVIGFVGRIAREKDILTLLDAFRKVRDDDTVLLVVGEGVKSLQDQLKREKNIICVGSQDNVVPYLQAMDVFVLPSLTETSSLSTLEAMSCGICVICTPAGKVKEYINEGENGFIFPFRDVDLLTSKLKYVLENDIKRKVIGRNARKTIEENFRLDRMVKEIVKVLEEYSKD